MKKYIFILILILFSSFCYSMSIQSYLNNNNNIMYRDIADFKTIQFYNNNTVRFNDDENSETSSLWNNTFNYQLTENDHYLFLDLSSNNNRYRLLILLSDTNLIFYDYKLIFNGISKGSTELYYFPSEISASSELIEGNKIYYAKNISNLNLDEPWVEGVQGLGIGESISFSCNAEELIICSGYISVNNINLWKENSRPKRISVEFLSSGKSMEFNLLDTQNPQNINLGNIYSGKVIIKILDVYPGTKYKDTCIHSIMVKY